MKELMSENQIQSNFMLSYDILILGETKNYVRLAREE